MSISGLVVTLVANKTRAQRAVQAIRAAGPFTLGEAIGPRLPVALEAEDGQSAGSWHEWLTALDGVVKVDVAFVVFDPKEAVHVV